MNLFWTKGIHTYSKQLDGVIRLFILETAIFKRLHPVQFPFRISFILGIKSYRIVICRGFG